jgi:hypothetical protein
MADRVSDAIAPLRRLPGSGDSGGRAGKGLVYLEIGCVLGFAVGVLRGG